MQKTKSTKLKKRIGVVGGQIVPLWGFFLIFLQAQERRFLKSCFRLLHHMAVGRWPVIKLESWHRQTPRRIKVKRGPGGRDRPTSFLSVTYCCVCAAWTPAALWGHLPPRHSQTARSHVSNQRAASFLSFLSERIQCHKQSNCVSTFQPTPRTLFYAWFCAVWPFEQPGLFSGWQCN